MADLIYNALPVPRRKIVTIHPEESVKKSVNLMTDQDIGALVVIDDNDQVIGIVGERDIVRSCLHKCLNMEEAKVADVMHKEVTILSLNDVVEKAMQVMTATKRRHVLICDEHNQLLAILSIGDLLFYLLEDKTRVIEQLENYIHTY